MALWQFENNANDTKGGNNLTEYNTPTYDNVDFKEGAFAIDFERDNSEYCGITDGGLDLVFPGRSTAGEQSFSIGCWFKVETLEDSGLVAKTNSYELQIDSATQTVRFQVFYSGGSTTLAFGTPCSAGIWYHVGAVYDATDNSMKMRMWDDDAGNFLGANATATCDGDMVGSTGDLYVGRGLTGYHDGLMDEVVVFNDVLTDTEIDKIRAQVYDSTAVAVYVPDDYPGATGIQNAIQGEPDGTTIIVRNGTYRYIELGIPLQPTTQKNYLTIIAENEGGANIEGTGEDIPAVYIQDVTGTTIDGFNLRRSGGIGSGVFFFNSDTTTRTTVTVQNCDMRGDSLFRTGVRLLGYIDATITGNTIVGAQMAGIATSVELGIPLPNEDFLYGDSIVTIKENEIDGGTVSQRAGILLKGDDDPGRLNSVQVVIGGGGAEQNLIHNCGTAGIRLEDIYGPVLIENNMTYDNTMTGIALVDVGSVTENASVHSNTVYSNDQAGIAVAGATYLTITGNTIRDNGQAGVGFNIADILALYGKPVEASSQSVTITGNDVYRNAQGGIGILDAITGPVTISQNNIRQNSRGGIGIQNACMLEINRNSIYGNVFGGIHTGTDLSEGGGFLGALGSAVLTVGQNKIYRNGLGEFGSGIDVRHASGTIYNNLVYRNQMGGIRFGDYVGEIINNTVANNGQDGIGGGIVYDDLEGEVNDPPGGTLKDAPNYPLPVIRNNISVYSETAGLRVGVGTLPTEDTDDASNEDNLVRESDDGGQSCFVAAVIAAETPTLEQSEDCPAYKDRGDGGYYWDYNLLYCNNETCEGNPAERGWPNDCGWPGPYELAEEVCVTMHYAACAPLGLTKTHHDIISDPMFVDMAADNYRLTASSPARNAGDDGTDMGAYGGSNPIDW
ncbi:MAG: right-handed parallel beta-helix repeat-containing protein [Deltaproteobacteria bacterium]|nr:right-handed parallel beta-helix repeat-containing protein [Deltaproteobacteria bacterium]